MNTSFDKLCQSVGQGLVDAFWPNDECRDPLESFGKAIEAYISLTKETKTALESGQSTVIWPRL